MKKFFAFIAVLTGLSLHSATESQAKIKVITSITPLRSLVESVGGDLVDVTSIGRGTEDPHFVEVRPSFITQIGSAKLYVSIGMSLDFWARPLIDNSRNSGIIVVNASKGIHVLDLPTERVTAAMGDVHPEGNPHYWLDPYNIPAIVKNIVTGLAQVDPTNEAKYQANAKAFLEKLKSAAIGWQKRLAPYAGTKAVTYHQSWDYFADRYKIDVVGYVEPKPGIPPSGAHTEEVIKLMQRDKVKIIIQEPFYPSNTPDLIATKVGATVVKLPQLCDGAPGTNDYISLMEYDVSTLEKALKK